MKSIYELEALKRRGINPATLGCVMLEVEPIDVRKYVDADWAYFSINPDHQWIDGIQTEHHITLLYGLLENANTIKADVDEVLDGVQFGKTWISNITVFESPYADENYSCIVGEPHESAMGIRKAHSRLSMLPHVNTYPVYRPHVTLAYVKKEFTNQAKSALQGLKGLVITPMRLDYGYPE